VARAGGGQPATGSGLDAGLADTTWLREPMKQNNLYLVIGALVIAVIALGIYVYREETEPKGVELRIDESGISVQQK
jgi:hypothetical protein